MGWLIGCLLGMLTIWVLAGDREEWFVDVVNRFLYDWQRIGELCRALVAPRAVGGDVHDGELDGPEIEPGDPGG